MTKETVSIADLVLGYLGYLGAVVEPPAFGVYEVLLPDDVAQRWGIDPYQRFVFDGAHQHQEEGTVLLNYGHPLVDRIIEELRNQHACTRFFINTVRPHKPGLKAEIEKALSFPNARLFFLPNEQENVYQHHYLRFNFKVSLIADEKRELIVPIWMDVQRGYPVKGEEIERRAILDEENHFPDSPIAPILEDLASGKESGQSAGLTRGDPILSSEMIKVLAERAQWAIPHELGDTLEALQKRLARFLELDRARLNDYYDGLLSDLERRLQKADEERRPALEAKKQVIQAERQAKLLDVEQKYHLRIQVEFINCALIAVPKLDLTVEIRHRSTSIHRTVTWNPVLHEVEPLACDVCGLGGTKLHLCENGHLAHAECLAPQCVECKREYCKRCEHLVMQCVVCERPVCVRSLTRCKDCGRVTCSEHRGECHALGGEPRRLYQETNVVEAASLVDAKEQVLPGGEPAAREAEQEKKPARKSTTTKKPVLKKTVSSSKPLADYLEVYTDPSEETITAYVIRRQKTLAERTWSMEKEGIAVFCRCEKGWWCGESQSVYRPMENIEMQMNRLVMDFREEYRLPAGKVRYFFIRLGKAVPEKKLKIPAGWRDLNRIAQAQQEFDRKK